MKIPSTPFGAGARGSRPQWSACGVQQGCNDFSSWQDLLRRQHSLRSPIRRFHLRPSTLPSMDSPRLAPSPSVSDWYEVDRVQVPTRTSCEHRITSPAHEGSAARYWRSADPVPQTARSLWGVGNRYGNDKLGRAGE